MKKRHKQKWIHQCNHYNEGTFNCFVSNRCLEIQLQIHRQTSVEIYVQIQIGVPKNIRSTASFQKLLRKYKEKIQTQNKDENLKCFVLNLH